METQNKVINLSIFFYGHTEITQICFLSDALCKIPERYKEILEIYRIEAQGKYLPKTLNSIEDAFKNCWNAKNKKKSLLAISCLISGENNELTKIVSNYFKDKVINMRG